MNTSQTTTLLPSGFTVAGGYTLLERISRGAMGAVYRARNQQGEIVAVKHLIDTKLAARFETEAELLAILDHPRVVRVHGSVADETGEYLIMDLVDGPNLEQVLKERGSPGLPLEVVLDYARDLCDALQYVHDQQILHRDVKPQNLILSGDGVVLVDFGIARTMTEGDATIAIGTPRFMAPEVLAGGGVSVRSDVFGVAATLWTLLVGQPPGYGDRTQLSTIVPDLTKPIEAALRGGLEILPDRRFSSVEALARALGVPIRRAKGQSLALSAVSHGTERDLLEAIVRTAARVFDAAAASIALIDATTQELVYASAWGVAGREIVGVRLPPGHGIAGAVVATGEPEAVPDCRSDPRFAARIAEGAGYVPRTMLVVPLTQGDNTIGALSLLDRRDGEAFGFADAERAAPFAELIMVAVGLHPTIATRVFS